MTIFKTFRFFLFFCLSIKLVTAQDFYVSDSNGSDNNSGTIENPFKTINKGISMVSAGGTVYVMDGIYKNANYGSVDPLTNTNMNNQHVVTINKSGSESAYITLRNYPGHTPKIQFDGRGGIVISNNMNYIIVEGFEVEGPSQEINYEMAEADRDYKIQMAEDDDPSTNYNHSYFSGKGIWGGYGAHHNIIIRNNIVHDTPGSAIRFNDSDHILIENNIVYNSNWWTSSASSAIVLAESIAESGDNTNEIKMIIRGNIVYNNWNRIRFYVTQLPDNSGNNNPNYGTANFQYIWDGQGIYVTRSDPDYAGTFLFENNLCLNNGKNGINFDHSHGASAIYQNNTLYYNGVHEIIQDISEAEGNPRHSGQKVGGIKANHVLNATVVNNIIMTRDNEFSALELNNVYGGKVAVNNIIVNGTYAWPATESNNIINEDPQFVSAPQIVNGPINVTQTDFSVNANSPAINAGNPNYSPADDIDGNPRPEIGGDAISSTSFENGSGGWTNFGSEIQISSDESLTGNNSLLTSDRTANWHSPKISLNNLLNQDETYTFYVWVKLAEGETGTAQLTIKDVDENEYYNLNQATEVSDQEWTLLNADFTYSISNNLFLYVKGPPVQAAVGADYYIDDFSLVNQGSPPDNFESSNDIVDIGAYEYTQAIVDNESPTLLLTGSDLITIEVGTAFTDPGATATDNYDEDVTVITTGTVDVNTVGIYTLTYTATDSSNNTSSIIRIINVVDTIGPEILCDGLDIYLDENGEALIVIDDIVASVSDISGVAEVSTTSELTFDCSMIGSNEVVITAIDNYGNSSQCIPTVIVIDQQSPELACVNINVTLENGLAVITEDDIDNGSYDNCGIESIELSHVEFTEDDLGSNTVIMTVTDVNDNVSSCEVEVMVEAGLSVTENILDDLLLYPNPTSSIIYLSKDVSMDYVIYNSIGQKLGQGITLGQIDISQLANGIYYIKLEKDNKSTTRKIIKN